MKMWGVFETEGKKMIAAFLWQDHADQYAAKWQDAQRPTVQEVDVKEVDVVTRVKLALEPKTGGVS